MGPIVHRDLKPLNIMFERRGTPKLTDFGLAAIGNVAAIETRNPGKWEHEGTFGYKSPEQLSGAAIDARSDLFNVGLIAYLLFGASHPFTDPRFLFNYKEMVLEPYRALPPISLGRASDGIAEFLGRLLATQPEDRFASASEALAELDHIEGIYRDDLLERVLGFCDFLKGTATQQVVVTVRAIAEGICLCKRSGFYVQGILLFEKSGADFSEVSPALRESLENDYGFCRRRAGQQVEAD
jgi:serine/threonine protein kinase